MDDSLRWYLLKHDDGSQFGPIDFAQLEHWSREAQISPQDKVSNDGKNWIKAPMVPELHMDYLIEVSPDQFYGPTTVGSVRQFYQMGEIDGNARVTNCRDGSESLICEVPELMADPNAESAEESHLYEDLHPAHAGDHTHGDEHSHGNLRISLQQRILDLEAALLEERRAHERSQRVIEQLETQLVEMAASR